MALDTKVIERVITIDAPPETVFRLLTDPVQYVRWKGRLAELEPRPGGKFRVEFPSTKDIAAGKYVEVIRDRRVVFTWGWEGNEMVPPGSSTVEIDLQPMGSGTRLRLVHRGLPQAAIASHTNPWPPIHERPWNTGSSHPVRWCTAQRSRCLSQFRLGAAASRARSAAADRTACRRIPGRRAPRPLRRFPRQPCR